MSAGVASSCVKWATLKSNATRPLDAIRALAETVTHAAGWRRWVLAFVAGSVSVLAMAPFFLWPVLFLTLPVLVWLIDGAQRQGGDASSFWKRPVARAGVAGWWFGFGYLLFGLFWIGEAFLVEADKFAWLLPFAVTLLPAGLALFPALAAAAARLVWPAGAERIIVLAITWALAEWLRGHAFSGFPWNLLGYALTAPLEMMQAASLTGAYGLSLLAVLIFASPLVLLAGPVDATSKRRCWAAALIAILPLLTLYGFGAWRLSAGASPLLDGVRMRIVQASVDQRDKWRPEKQGAIFHDQLDLSRHDASGRRDDLAGITHLVWPEAAMPFLPLDHPEALAAIGELLPPGTQLITGALRLKHPAAPRVGGAREGFNSLMVFGDQGNLEAVYDKIHLVPFGEYLPFQPVLERLGLEQLTRWRGGFTGGPYPRPLLSIPGLPPVAVLICYEAIFPAAIVQGSDRPGLLVNVTNDGWFGDTTGPQQHFHQTRVRAVEEGLPIVRSANNGVSAVIDGYGRILSELRLNARGVIDSPVPAALAAPPYARFGDWTFVAMILALAAAATFLARNQRR
jgi:apolipoprotein N-acyltransferase